MADVKFSGEPPPASLLSDIQALNKFKDKQFEEVVKIILTFLIDPSKTSKLLDQLGEFAEQHGLEVGPLKKIIRSVLTILDGAIKKSLSSEEVQEDLIKLGLSEEQASYLAQMYKAKLMVLSRTVAGHTLMVNQLVDMEWKFGVTAASSEVKTVGNTFLQLKLVVNKGNKTENVYMELTLPQFYSFLHEMERAKASLEFFS